MSTKNKGLKFEREGLSSLYNDTSSISVIARMFGVSVATIRYHLTKHKITHKTSGYKSPKSIRSYAEKHHNWKGGEYNRSGYIMQYAPDHPNNQKGYVLQHRLVVEKNLGRLLNPDELVHHINGIKTDNRIENLSIMERGEHIRGHKVNSPRDKKGRFSK